MVSEIEEPLGDVGRVDSALGDLALSRKDAFMHADPVVGEVVVRLQTFLDVVGVQDGNLADPADTFRAQGPDVGVCLDEDVEVSVEGLDLSDRVGAVAVPVIPTVLLDDLGDGEKVREFFDNAYGAAAGGLRSHGGSKRSCAG